MTHAADPRRLEQRSSRTPENLPPDMIMILCGFAAVYALISGLLVWLFIGSQMVSHANAVMIGGGLFTSVLPQILRRHRWTIAFFLPFFGGFVLAWAGIVDALRAQPLQIWPPEPAHVWFAALGFLLVVAGLAIDASARSSVWIWESAPWGVPMTYWPQWVRARRLLTCVFSILVIAVIPGDAPVL